MSNDHAAVREIRIKDFRCIEDLHFSFLNPQGNPNRVVVFGGPNGCGKTAVLEAIVLAGGGFGSDAAPIAIRSVPIEGNSFEIDGKARIGKHEIHLHASFDLKNHGVAKAGLRFMSLDDLPFEYTPSRRTAGILEEVHISGASPPSEGTSRLIDIQQRLVDALLHELLSGQRNGAGTTPYSKAIDSINEAWQRFYPGQSFAVEPIAPTPNHGFNVFLQRKGKKRLGINLLSSGQLELFGFIGDLATRESKPSIIVIDEPELHLDPQWHRFVLQTLLELRPRSQIIVGTHSPEIFASVASYERHFLIPNDDPRTALWQRELTEAGVAK